MAPLTTQRATRALQDLQTAAASARSSLASDASPSSPDVLHTLYSVLLKTRLLEEHVLSLLQARKLPAATLPVLGSEATEVGACVGLQPDDSFASSEPRLAIHVVKNTPLDQVFARLYHGDGQNFVARRDRQAEPVQVVPQAVTVSGLFDISAGVALAYQRLAKANVVVVLACDALAALGFWHQAASLASRNRLPIVFMVENSSELHVNGSAEVNFDADLRDRAETYGFPGITVDGNDMVAVWRVAQESIHRARSGAGPTLIECRMWRRHAAGERFAANGRSNSKLLRTQPPGDPLLQMEQYMKKRGLWQQTAKEKLITNYRQALTKAVKSADRIAKSG